MCCGVQGMELWIISSSGAHQWWYICACADISITYQLPLNTGLDQLGLSPVGVVMEVYPFLPAPEICSKGGNRHTIVQRESSCFVCKDSGLIHSLSKQGKERSLSETLKSSQPVSTILNQITNGLTQCRAVSYVHLNSFLPQSGISCRSSKIWAKKIASYRFSPPLLLHSIFIIH